MTTCKIRSYRYAFGVALLLLATTAHADWKIYYTGKAAKMFGGGGRGNFESRSQCESYRISRPGFESGNSYCSGFDLPSTAPAKPKPPAENPVSQAQAQAAAQAALHHQEQLRKAEEEARIRFAAEKQNLLQSLKDVGPPPETPASPPNSDWSSGQCEFARKRVDSYRQSLHKAVEVSKRLSRQIAADQDLRTEWEETMNDAVERAKNRGQFLWLAVPLGRLKSINEAAVKDLDGNASKLADLLAGSVDPTQRTAIRVARQFNQSEREAVVALDKQYENIGAAITLGGNAPLIFEDGDDSPTSPLHGDTMKLREAGEMLFDVIVEREQWKKVASNAPWAKYIAGGLSAAFKTEAAARAMFDSWYDALASALSWKQLTAMNLNADRYFAAVRKLEGEIRRRGDLLKGAQAEMEKVCSPVTRASPKEP